MRSGVLATVTAAALLVGVPPATAADDDVAHVRGTVQRIAVDRADGTGETVTLVVPPSGDVVRVPDDLTGVRPGAVVDVTYAVPAAWRGPDVPVDVLAVTPVVAAEPALLPSSGAVDERLLAAPNPPIVGGVRPVHVVLATISGQAADGTTTSALADTVDGAVGEYFGDATGDALSFSVASQRSIGTYTGWGSLSTCTFTQQWAFLEWAAARVGVPVQSWPGHLVVYTPRLTACGFAGVGTLSLGGSVWLNGAPGWTIVAHELGHTLLLEHSNTRVLCRRGGAPVADGGFGACTDTEYGDLYDVMGPAVVYGSGPGVLSGAHLDTLGLLPPTGTLAPVGPTRVLLEPVGGLTGTRFLRIDLPPRTYYVEYRTPVGRDDGIGSELMSTCIQPPTGLCQPARFPAGVLVRRAEWPGQGATYLLNAPAEDPAFTGTADEWFALTAGRAFTAEGGAIRIEVVEVTPAGAVVDVTMPGAPYDQIVMSRDLTGDGAADVVTVDTEGVMHLSPGDGHGWLGAMRRVSEDWSGMRVFAPGDWNGDARSDLLSVDGGGDLWLYPGRNNGTLAARVKAGFGWTGYRIVPTGDMNGDKKNDLLAMDSVGRLWLYPGVGGGLFGRRVQVGNGWTGFELYAAGDANRDGRNDILSVDSAGRLWFYSGRGGGFFNKRVQVGYGWTGYAFASGADLNRDGSSDLLGRDASGRLWFYAGKGAGTFAKKVQIANGW